MEERFDCPICGSDFSSDEDLRYHGQHEHGETFLAAVRERLKEEGEPVGDMGEGKVSPFGDLVP